jgi:hypothetical protein
MATCGTLSVALLLSLVALGYGVGILCTLGDGVNGNEQNDIVNGAMLAAFGCLSLLSGPAGGG